MLNLGFIRPLEKILNYFFNEVHLKRQTRLFKFALYGLVLLKLFYYSVYYELYFGENSLVYSQSAPYTSFRDLAYLLYSSSSTVLPAISIAITVVSSLFALIFKRYTFLPDLIIWFCVMNLHNKVYATLTGGDFLLNQFLLFSCFLTFRNLSGRFLFDLRRLCHNMTCVALYIQICFIYLFSGLFKIGDTQWLDGSALFTIAQVDHFSLFSAFRSNTWSLFFRIMTWFVLVYQCLFPILMWFRRIKKPLLIIGVLMHVYIGLVLGLLQFSLVMIAAYVFLWPAKDQTHLK